MLDSGNIRRNAVAGMHEIAGMALAGFATLVAIRVAVYRPGLALRQKFIDLGTLAGRSRAQILAAVGQPTSTSPLPDGKELLRWQCAGCNISLRFAGEICEGVVHQLRDPS